MSAVSEKLRCVRAQAWLWVATELAYRACRAALRAIDLGHSLNKPMVREMTAVRRMNEAIRLFAPQTDEIASGPETNR